MPETEYPVACKRSIGGRDHFIPLYHVMDIIHRYPPPLEKSRDNTLDWCLVKQEMKRFRLRGVVPPQSGITAADYGKWPARDFGGFLQIFSDIPVQGSCTFLVQAA